MCNYQTSDNKYIISPHPVSLDWLKNNFGRVCSSISRIPTVLNFKVCPPDYRIHWVISKKKFYYSLLLLNSLTTRKNFFSKLKYSSIYRNYLEVNHEKNLYHGIMLGMNQILVNHWYQTTIRKRFSNFKYSNVYDVSN